MESSEMNVFIKNIGNWFFKNWLYMCRVAIAFLVLINICLPLVNNFSNYIGATDFKDFVSVTVKENPPLQTHVAKDTSKGVCEEGQSGIETVRESSSAPRVWAYGWRTLGGGDIAS